jgi:hypothetical protein
MPPTDARRGIVWKTCTRVRWARLDSLIVVMNCGHSWCLLDSRVPCCQVIGFKLIRTTTTLLDMSDSCLLQSFNSNSTSLCCYENYIDDVDYFVVMT